jgi:chemotaxis family two-component system response regulator Rcp1
MAEPVTILLVEDEPADVRLTQIALQQAKLVNELHVVTDGEQALDFLHRRGQYAAAPRPDLVLLDLNLPRVSGHEVLEDIRASDELTALPVIVLTTSSSQRDVVESYRRHANCFISKPVGVEEFLKVVATIEDFWLTIVRLPKPSD